MFAAATYVLLAEWLMKRKTRIFLIGLLLLFGLIFYAFYVSSNHDLQMLGKQIPCYPVMVVHESPFSYSPLEVLNREYGCGWTSVISTNMTRKQASGMGLDVVDEDKVYWNQTFPDGPLYIVHADENHTLPNRTTVEVYDGDGVSLLYVEG
jgi:hypothetical protein